MPPLPPLAIALLASAADVPADATISQGMVWGGGLVAFSICANQVTGFWNNLRKLRGNDPAADNRYATKEELAASIRPLSENILKVEAELAAGDTRFSKIEQTISNELISINRALGKIEGYLEKNAS
ncbi:MAG: hypothetical protein QM680_14570 [Luteolibacter sp.]